MSALTPENPGGRFKSLHGRVVGILGDDLGHNHVYLGGPNGKVVASTRLDINTVVSGVAAAGPITLAGALVGDLVVGVINMSTPSDDAANFESVISVAGQLQQTSASNLSANKYHVFVKRQS